MSNCGSCPPGERLKCWGTDDLEKIKQIQRDQANEDEGFSKAESEFWG